MTKISLVVSSDLNQFSSGIIQNFNVISEATSNILVLHFLQGCNQGIIIRPIVIRPRSLSINLFNAALLLTSNQRYHPHICHSIKAKCCAMQLQWPLLEKVARLHLMLVSLFQSPDFKILIRHFDGNYFHFT